MAWKSPGKALTFAEELARHCGKIAPNKIKEISIIELREGLTYRALSIKAQLILANNRYVNAYAFNIRKGINMFLSMKGFFKNRRLGIDKIHITLVDTFIRTKWKFKVLPKYVEGHSLIDFYKKHEGALKIIYDGRLRRTQENYGKIILFKVNFEDDRSLDRVILTSNIWFKGGFFTSGAIELLERSIGIAEAFFSKKLAQEPPLEPLKTFKIMG